VTVSAELERGLLTEIQAATGREDLTFAGEPVGLTGGFWAELVAFRLADPPPGWPPDLVARVMPDPFVARKESIMQAAVAASGFPTPAVRLTGGPESRIGRAFMVMDKATGSSLMPGLDGIGALAAGLRAGSRLPDVLASTMATLHAVDPQPVRDNLAGLNGVASSVPGMLAFLCGAAERAGRGDLVAAADFLIASQREPGREVICHGDLHPFNVLVDGGHVTLLDWSASLLGSPAYDVAFTTLMLSEPPLDLPGRLRPPVRWLGRLLARRFVGRYETYAGATIGRDDLRWYQAVVCLRMLVEVAGWVRDGTIDGRAGHPFLTSGRELAARLSSVTGLPVRPR
jgi:aminoglycoside phosphotransferase (APT) family kinase protein